MNDKVKIQLFRDAATMPWAEVETTQHNIRMTYYEGAEENAKENILVLSKDEACAIAKTLRVLAENYCYKKED